LQVPSQTLLQRLQDLKALTEDTSVAANSHRYSEVWSHNPSKYQQLQSNQQGICFQSPPRLLTQGRGSGSREAGLEFGWEWGLALWQDKWRVYCIEEGV
jgi:hypothetical protein